eukprot:CAMPEP_0198196832 /NCGR_PEP_ID=MMETSP1445-20131203/279_1 /TAXON_ID=36898 /ORGANISM="Pyramimonas sp., Strain CCMP2087" /LENGTH=274 /DNA_ID=CAMNT_0043865827 /DNA_START=58 /DNA_END=879 /DNA_ORIENTATION=+
MAEPTSDIEHYFPSTWSGTLPKESLIAWCIEKKANMAFYELRSKSAEDEYIATCFLPADMVKITPDWHSPNLEEAEQNAALLASVYLVGGKVNPKSVSHLPAAVKLTIPIEQAVAKVQLKLAGLAKKQEELQSQTTDWTEILLKLQAGGREATTAALLVENRLIIETPVASTQLSTPLQQPETKRKPEGETSLVSDAKRQRTEDKSPIALLKEYCDRHKWNQPVYEVTTVQPTGPIRVQQFKCKIVMQDQNPNFEESEIEVGIKIAKKNAAAAW